VGALEGDWLQGGLPLEVFYWLLESTFTAAISCFALENLTDILPSGRRGLESAYGLNHNISLLPEIGVKMMDQLSIVHAYRHLYRKGLQAIRYATPQRHVLRRSLRSSFRSGSHADFDPKKIARTLEFFERASESTSLEHKIIKNLMFVRYWEQPHIKKEAKV
jgi:hypothetical protein